eukprot:scaffold535_cov260-Pinguiococcus_pyrenoidosus.AAC.31
MIYRVFLRSGEYQSRLRSDFPEDHLLHWHDGKHLCLEKRANENALLRCNCRDTGKTVVLGIRGAFALSGARVSERRVSKTSQRSIKFDPLGHSSLKSCAAPIHLTLVAAPELSPYLEERRSERAVRAKQL